MKHTRSVARKCGMRTHLIALGVLAVIVVYGVEARATEADVDSVVASASTALGARDIPQLRALHVTATGHQLGLPASTDAYTNLASGGVNATYARIGDFSSDSGYDGRAVWTRDQSGVVWVDGSEQAHSAAVNEAYRESYALWTPLHGGASLAQMPSQAEKQRVFDVIQVTPPGSDVPFAVWIDRATHLPSRYVETVAAVTTTTELSDYHDVKGVELPFAVRQTSDQGNETDSTVTHVDVAPADLATKLTMPHSAIHDFSIAGGETTTMPFELIDNHVYIDVLLEGKGPYRFIFDTGGQNLVDSAVAKEVGAAPVGSVQGGGVGAATEQFAFSRIRSLRVGNAELRDQLFVVAPVRAGFGVSGSTPVDGIIGAEVLARFVTVFDYAQHRIELKRPGSVVSGTPIPFVFAGTQPQVPCEIDRIPTQCSIDTGSRSSLDLFSPFIAANAAVVPPNVSAPGVNGFGVGGADVGRLGRLSTIRIGGFELKNLVAGYSSAKSGAFAVPGIGANIGGGMLKRFTVTFDYPHQTMSLQPNGMLGIPDDYERSGLFIVNAKGFNVAGVRPGTPAAQAGIVKGDTIVSLNGTPASGLTLGQLRDALRGPDGTRVRVGILRKGETAQRAITMTLRDYV